MQESGLIEIIPLLCILATEGQYPVLFHLVSPQGALMGVAVVAEGLAVGSLVVSIPSCLRVLMA